MTIPANLRSKLDIHEGATLEVSERDGRIVMTPVPPLEGGEVVGEVRHRQLIEELEESRSHWR